MASVRLQAYCPGCGTILDVTVHSTKVQAIVGVLNDSHRPICFEHEEVNKPDGGDQEVPDSGSDSTDPPAEAVDGAEARPPATKLH